MVDRSIIARYNKLFNDLGRAGMNAAFPNDFEYYFTALELTDSLGNTIDYLAFPINPSSIMKSVPKRTNIKMSSAGITSLRSRSFTPQEIMIKGNFGRSFKVLVAPNKYEESAAFSISSGAYSLQDGDVNSLNINTGIFDASFKTGYGVTKLLQSIVEKSSGLDRNGKPLQLYFYNLGLGESYLVEVPSSGLTIAQEEGENMIWGYTLNLTVLAPLQLVKTSSKNSQINLLSTSVVQSGINTLARDLKTIL